MPRRRARPGGLASVRAASGQAGCGAKRRSPAERGRGRAQMSCLPGRALGLWARSNGLDGRPGHDSVVAAGGCSCGRDWRSQTASRGSPFAAHERHSARLRAQHRGRAFGPARDCLAAQRLRQRLCCGAATHCCEPATGCQRPAGSGAPQWPGAQLANCAARNGRTSCLHLQLPPLASAAAPLTAAHWLPLLGRVALVARPSARAGSEPGGRQP